MLGVLGTLVVVNALFVLAVLWGVGVLLPTTVAAVVAGKPAVLTGLLRLPVSPAVAAALIAIFLAAQLYYGYERVLAGTRAPDGESEHAVARTVGKLAMSANVPTPAVRVVESDESSCYTIGRLTDATIVVTTGLIDSLDVDELEVVLAHEIAHIANRDVTLMTVTTLSLEITDRVYHATRIVPRKLLDGEQLSRTETLVFKFAFPLATLVYVLVSPVLWLFPLVTGWATSSLAHSREYAADTAAARMTGKPLALATALTTLSETTTAPETDLRRAKTCALCIVPSEPVTGRTTGTVPQITRPQTDQHRLERIRSWLDRTTHSADDGLGTHPPVEKRIGRLRDIAAEMEGVR
jgi:Zn-dependent protease with chaperone function